MPPGGQGEAKRPNKGSSMETDRGFVKLMIMGWLGYFSVSVKPSIEGLLGVQESSIEVFTTGCRQVKELQESM